MSVPVNHIIQGDALQVLVTLPAESVNCCVTSPPYWGLRDYKVEGQLGLEPTPELYVQHLVEIFREVKRVLRSDGTLWLNMGDSYASQGGREVSQTINLKREGGSATVNAGNARSPPHGLKPKDLCGIPWRVAFALQADGWYLRSDIVWSKSNPMPESVTDRPTKAHEYVFLLAKSAHYFFDQDAVRETNSPTSGRWGKQVKAKLEDSCGQGKHGKSSMFRPNMTWEEGQQYVTAGRNIRSVWTIPTQPFKGAHFATFPERLVEPMIKAGCPEWVCETCGKPRERIVEAEHITREAIIIEYGGKNAQKDTPKSSRQMLASLKRAREATGSNDHPSPSKLTVGWSDCGHNNYQPGVVLDPFCGSGTACLVAAKLNRSYIGIDLSEKYCKMAKDRVAPYATKLTSFTL